MGNFAPYERLRGHFYEKLVWGGGRGWLVEKPRLAFTNCVSNMSTQMMRYDSDSQNILYLILDITVDTKIHHTKLLDVFLDR